MVKNEQARYIIVGRIMEGATVLGYYIADTATNTREALKKEDVEQLALTKQIRNITAQVYEGKTLIKGTNFKLSELPKFNREGVPLEAVTKQPTGYEYRITARLVDGRKTTGYVITKFYAGAKQASQAVTRDRAICLARDGALTNARVQMYNGGEILRGVNCELDKLEAVKLS